MDKNIYNIGKLRYLRTIVFGTNCQIKKETIETKDENGEMQTEINPCDYIVSMGKRAIIITVPLLNNPNNRLAHVVKPWKFIGYNIENNIKMKAYIDNEGHKWMYLKDRKGEMISYYKDVSKFFHLET